MTHCTGNGSCVCAQKMCDLCNSTLAMAILSKLHSINTVSNLACDDHQKN